MSLGLSFVKSHMFPVLRVPASEMEFTLKVPGNHVQPGFCSGRLSKKLSVISGHDGVAHALPKPVNHCNDFQWRRRFGLVWVSRPDIEGSDARFFHA